MLAAPRLLEKLGLESLLAGRGIAASDCDSLLKLPAEAARAEYSRPILALRAVSHAIAEPGSLVMMARPGQERLASLLPPVHVAIVERAQISARSI